MAKKFYFFKTVKVGTKVVVNPLPSQVDDSGAAVENLNVSCSHELRDRYAVGTIFVGDTLTKRTKGTKDFYTTTSFRRLVTREADAVASFETLTGTKFEKTPSADISMREIIASDPALLAPSSKKDGFYVTQEDWSILVRNVKRHINTLIIGPTGSGKTSVIKELCDRLELPLHVFDMGSMQDPISSLLGVHRLEAGKSVFDYAQFTKVIQEPGVILLDELSRASLAADNVLFPCLDDRRKLTIEVAGSKDIREIDVHPEVTFIATANVGAEYTGTNGMDKALVNRFFPLELGYIPKNEEAAVLINRCEIDPDKANIIVKIANNIRSLADKQEISSSLSIRETIMVAELVRDGWEPGQAMEMIFLPMFEGTKSEGERSTVFKTISSY